MPEEFERYNHFLNRVEITRESRFNAEKRLLRRHKRSYFIISMLSLFVILMSMLPSIETRINDQQAQILLALTILNSVFIIVTTLMDGTGNYALKAHYMNRSGRQLSTIFNKLKLATAEEKVDRSFLADLQEQYQEVLNECPFNHEDVDYLLVQLHRPNLFHYAIPSKPFPQFCFRLVLLVRSSLLLFAWCLPHVSVVIFSLFILAKYAEAHL